ncbi:class I SAM-dependent methyltransferase [Emergencia timonensis]|uniref:class I SAM-dependent methyltransferase n=1 Tax=Emergencia timonensis TaxID=1776384 RepID=UPI00399327CC
MNNPTLTYYNENVDAFLSSTTTVDLSEIQDQFLSYLNPGDRILDLGCGSGRDTKYFLDEGFVVDAVDGSDELVIRASSYTGIQVKRMLFAELACINKYDGIWACASLLHLPYSQLSLMLDKIARALNEHGIFYASFKYGEFEGERNGRYFTDLNEERCRELIGDNGKFHIECLWTTGDARPEKGEEKWLNMILIKDFQNQR